MLLSITHLLKRWIFGLATPMFRGTRRIQDQLLSATEQEQGGLAGVFFEQDVPVGVIEV